MAGNIYEEVILPSGVPVLKGKPGDHCNGKVLYGRAGEWDALTPEQAGFVRDISMKADKVEGGTEDNFVSLDENGNIKDSGSKASDFVTDISGKADKLTPYEGIAGNIAILDEEGNLDDQQQTVADILNPKADKVEEATEGNFAGLDAEGNITDSGKKPSDIYRALISGSSLLVNPDDPMAVDDTDMTTPFVTIQGALNVLPTPTQASEMRQAWTVFIAPGTYDEDLTIDGTLKRIYLLGLGPVNLGTFDAQYWAPSGTARNIVWNMTSEDGFSTSIREALVIATIDQYASGVSTHLSYNSCFRISGGMTASGPPLYTTSELYFDNVEIFGDVNLEGHAGLINTYAKNSRFKGAFTKGAGTADIYFHEVRNNRFDGLVTVGRYSNITNCDFKAGFTVDSASSGGVGIQGFFNSKIAGTFTGPAGSLILDSVTDSSSSGLALAGGATKVYKGIPFSGVSETKTFYASSSSGGSPTVLNTVTIVNGIITSWTQV